MASATHTWSTSTNYDTHDVTGLSGGRLYHLVFASGSGGYIDDGTMGDILDAVLDALYGPALTISPASFTAAPGAVVAVEVTVDGADHDPGTHTLDIEIASNDPDQAVVTVPLNSPGTGNALTVTNTGGPAGLIITVQGYYEKPLAGFISPSGSPYSGSSRIINGSRTSAGVYEVQFDRNIRYCSANATAYVSNYYASATTWYDSSRPDTVRVYVWDANGAAADQYFYIQVNC